LRIARYSENNFDNNVISHSVKILERNNIFISGTKKVHNFNENEFLINTVMGNINIKGNNLQDIMIDTNINVKEKLILINEQVLLFLKIL